MKDEPIEYTVKRGDTVAGIALTKLGNMKEWREIVAINNLKILPGNIVIIYPGQVLKLRDMTPIDVEAYRETTREFVWQWAFRLRHIEWTEYDERAIRVGWVESEMAPGDFNKQFMVHYSIKYMEDKLKILRKQQVKLLAEGIYNKATEMSQSDDHLFLRGEDYVKERQAALLLTALCWQESTFRFVLGAHGEVGPFQIKPSTAYEVTRGEWGAFQKEQAMAMITDKLMFDFDYMLDVVGQILLDKPTMTSALVYYNKGSMKHQYAREIMQKYHKLVGRLV